MPSTARKVAFRTAPHGYAATVSIGFQGSKTRIRSSFNFSHGHRRRLWSVRDRQKRRKTPRPRQAASFAKGYSGKLLLVPRDSSLSDVLDKVQRERRGSIWSHPRVCVLSECIFQRTAHADVLLHLLLVLCTLGLSEYLASVRNYRSPSRHWRLTFRVGDNQLATWSPKKKMKERKR